MGRTLKRVPLDFDWPLNEVWEGYLTPAEFQFPTCSTCSGDGYSVEARAIADGQAEVDHLIEKVKREPTEDNPRDWGLPRTAEDVNAENRPGRRGLGGHDAINRMILISFRCERLGIVERCSTCGGHGDIATDEQRAEAEKDHTVEPPEGEGYQLWETTSEGSPVSPVFATMDALCEYAAANCSTFGSDTASAEGWRKMLDEDFVASAHPMAGGGTAVFI